MTQPTIEAVECKDCCDSKVCRSCNGDGWLMSDRDTAKDGTEECPDCGGSGVCPWCDE
jgi:hypothetical protein